MISSDQVARTHSPNRNVQGIRAERNESCQERVDLARESTAMVLNVERPPTVSKP